MSMLNKSDIVNLAFLKVGEQNQLFNMNITDRLAIASTLFEQCINEIATDSNFMFNAKTVLLNLNLLDKNYRGEYKYNLPIDYLNKIWISDREARIEGKFVYSTQEKVEMCYCYKMDLVDYPDYVTQYVVLKLAIKLTEAYDIYAHKKQWLEAELRDSTNKLLVSEGLPFPIPR